MQYSVNSRNGCACAMMTAAFTPYTFVVVVVVVVLVHNTTYYCKRSAIVCVENTKVYETQVFLLRRPKIESTVHVTNSHKNN